MIYLREINKDNFFDVIRLKVSEEQKNFVASNVFSIAQSKVQTECIPHAIYNDTYAVGFLMYCIDCDDNNYWIYRLMIDEKYQSNGYGKKAMEIIIERIKEDKSRNVIYISFEPENESARLLYEKLGFVSDNRIIEEELVYKLEY